MGHYFKYWREMPFLGGFYQQQEEQHLAAGKQRILVYLTPSPAHAQEAGEMIDEVLPQNAQRSRVVSRKDNRHPFWDLFGESGAALIVLGMFLLVAWWQMESWGAQPWHVVWGACQLTVGLALFATLTSLAFFYFSSSSLRWLTQPITTLGMGITGVVLLWFLVSALKDYHPSYPHYNLFFWGTLLWMAPVIIDRSLIKIAVALSIVLVALVEILFSNVQFLSLWIEFLGNLVIKLSEGSGFLWLSILLIYITIVALSLGMTYYRRRRNMLIQDGFFYQLKNYASVYPYYTRIALLGIIPVLLTLGKFFSSWQGEMGGGLLEGIWLAAMEDVRYLATLLLGSYYQWQELLQSSERSAFTFISAVILAMGLYCFRLFYTIKRMSKRRDLDIDRFLRQNTPKLLIVKDVDKETGIKEALKYYWKGPPDRLMLVVISSLSHDLWQEEIKKLKSQLPDDFKTPFTREEMEKSLENITIQYFESDHFSNVKRVVAGKQPFSNTRVFQYAEQHKSKGVITRYRKGFEAEKYVYSQLHNYKIIADIHFKEGTPEDVNALDVVLAGAGFEVKDGKIRSRWRSHMGALIAIVPLFFNYVVPFIFEKVLAVEELAWLKKDLAPIFTTEMQFSPVLTNFAIGVSFFLGAGIFFFYQRGHVSRYEDYRYHFLVRWLKRKYRMAVWGNWFWRWFPLKRANLPQALVLHDIDRAPAYALSYLRDVVRALDKEKLLVVATWNLVAKPDFPGVDGKTLFQHDVGRLSPRAIKLILDDEGLLKKIPLSLQKDFIQYSCGIPEQVTRGLFLLRKFSAHKLLKGKVTEWEKWKREALENKLEELECFTHEEQDQDIKKLLLMSYYHQNQPPSLNHFVHNPKEYKEQQQVVACFLKGWERMDKLKSPPEIALTFLKYFPAIPKPYSNHKPPKEQ